MVDFYLPPKAVQRMRNTPDSVNYKFAEYYLRYLLPEDEFEKIVWRKIIFQTRLRVEDNAGNTLQTYS